MEVRDTVNLLRECNAGSKMAISSIDDVLDRVQSSGMRQLLTESKNHHEKMCDEIHTLLARHESEEKDPNPIAKGMSWIKTNVKMSMDDSDSTVANLMTDGCHMGVKSLHKYLNQYSSADHTSKDICGRLIDIEEQLCKGLESYL